LIMKAVDGRAAAEIDPADVGGINVAGADVGGDHHPVVGVTAPIQPADVGTVGVAVDRVNGRATPCASKAKG